MAQPDLSSGTANPETRPRRRARFVFPAVFLVLAGGGAGGWWFSRPPSAMEWQGYAEADFVKVGPTQQGLLTAVRVSRGDYVAMGAPLFDQDDGEVRPPRDVAERQLDHDTLKTADWKLAQRHMTSPVTGRVADVLARAGETLDVGAPVVSLLPPGNIFVRFFVPEPLLSTVHFGDRVLLSWDNGRDVIGTINFIAPHAEYTPPMIYSEENRAKLVFMVQAQPPLDQALLLNPGQPVTVRPLKP